jgi:hypothetical protein
MNQAGRPGWPGRSFPIGWGIIVKRTKIASDFWEMK